MLLFIAIISREKASLHLSPPNPSSLSESQVFIELSLCRRHSRHPARFHPCSFLCRSLTLLLISIHSYISYSDVTFAFLNKWHLGQHPIFSSQNGHHANNLISHEFVCQKLNLLAVSNQQICLLYRQL